MSEAAEHRGWIELHDADGGIVVQAMAASAAPAVVRYELLSQTLDGPNRGQTSQTGAAHLAANTAQPLARLRLRMPSGQRYRIALRLFDGDRLAVEESLVLP